MNETVVLIDNVKRRWRIRRVPKDFAVLQPLHQPDGGFNLEQAAAVKE